MVAESRKAEHATAVLVEVDLSKDKAVELKQNGKTVTVHFNPQTLKVTYGNENKSADQPLGSASQFVGVSTSKLAVELLFDTTQTGKDVRATTADVAYFIKTDLSTAKQTTKQQKRKPPACRFEWGTFSFDGVMDSLQETLDYFSEDGVPLRSTLALGFSGFDTMLQPNPANGAPGTNPLTPAINGKSVAQLAGQSGNSANWKSIAAANNIDDPLHLPAGTLLDMSAGAAGSPGAGIGSGAGAGADLGFSAGLGGGVGFAAGASAGASAGIGAGAAAGFGASAGFGATAGVGASAGLGANLGVGTSTGVGASAGLAVSAGFGAAAAVGGGAGLAAGIGAKANAAGSAGGSFGAAAAAGGTVTASG